MKSNDRALILSSGFIFAEETSSVEKTAIETLEVMLTGPGEATLQVKNQKGVVSYIHQYTTEAPGPNTMWHSVGSTKGDHTFTGLATDKRYWFRVIVVGRKGQQAFSPVVSRSIQ